MGGAPERPALRGLARIVDLPVRIGAVARHARIRPDAFVAELESLIAGSGLGSTADADVVLACALWCLDQSDARLAELRAMAARDGRTLVAAILTDDAPHRGLARGGRLAPLDIPGTARVVRQIFAQSCAHHYIIDGIRYESRGWVAPPPSPLPKLTTAAEYTSYFEKLLADHVPEPYAWRPMRHGSIRGAVERLAGHHDPFTIGRLLDDPSVRERDVISIATRRPTTPALVRELTSRSRWMQLPNVRASLVANPCTPTRVALILAATCLPRLHGIAAAGNVHPRVRELSRLIRRHDESSAARPAD